MTNLILSLYRVFFIDDNHQLWTIMRDGRVVLMKNIPPFATFSSDHTILTGVEIDGKQTRFLWTMANFQQQSPEPIITHNGYCYYPTLLNTPHAQLAFLRADLLNPHGMGDTFIFKKARKKFHLTDSFSAAMYPPFFSKTGALYYINPKMQLTKRIMKQDEEIYPNTIYFALNAEETEYAVYSDETIRWLDFKIGQLRQFIAFDVTALGFNETGTSLFFATYKNGHSSLYQYDKSSQEITLILNHSTKITGISF